MNNNKRGFAPIATVLLVAAGIAVVGGAFYYYFHRQAAPIVASGYPPVATSTASTSAPTTTPSSTASSSLPITNYRSYLSPSSGSVGTVVTIHASGFAASGNQVLLNGMVGGSLGNLSSANGKTLTFAVPSSLGPNCEATQVCPMFLMEVTDGSYKVSVVSNGVTQNIGTFTVTGGVDLRIAS